MSFFEVDSALIFVVGGRPAKVGELRRLNPRAPVVHLVRLESEGRVWVEHRARAAV